MKHETIAEALRGQITAIELELKRQRERAESAEGRLKCASEQENEH